MSAMKLLPVLLCVGGCASSGERQAAVASPPAPPAPEAAVVLESLTDASLPQGECGMILWTLDETRPAPVFRYVSGKRAEIAVAGRTHSLSRLEGSGAAAFGVFEHQVFSGPDGLSVTVDARFSLGFDGGSYLERGLVTVEAPGGWRAVAPAAGIAGCRS